MPTKKDPENKPFTMKRAKTNAGVLGELAKRGAKAIGLGPQTPLADRRPDLKVSPNIEDRRPETGTATYDFEMIQKRINDIKDPIAKRGNREEIMKYNSRVMSNRKRTFTGTKGEGKIVMAKPAKRKKPAPTEMRPKARPKSKPGS